MSRNKLFPHNHWCHLNLQYLRYIIVACDTSQINKGILVKIHSSRSHITCTQWLSGRKEQCHSLLKFKQTNQKESSSRVICCSKIYLFNNLSFFLYRNYKKEMLILSKYSLHRFIFSSNSQKIVLFICCSVISATIVYEKTPVLLIIKAFFYFFLKNFFYWKPT